MFHLTCFEQYDHDRDRDIVTRLNIVQERHANERGTSTVWQCDQIGHYWGIDLDDERYMDITFGDQRHDRMVYHLAVAAANTRNPRDYSDDFMQDEEHFAEYTRAFTNLAFHNRQINEHWEATRIFREQMELAAWDPDRLQWFPDAEEASVDEDFDARSISDYSP